MTEAWKGLKSGTDIRGVALDGAGQKVTLTEEMGISIGRAFALWLAESRRKQPKELTIALGRDSRLTGPGLLSALLSGITREGVKALRCDLCTTPAMFMTTVLAACDGAVMVTASHLPYERNGYKFFTPSGGLTGEDILDILERASRLSPDPGDEKGIAFPFLTQYTAFLMEKVHAALGEDAPLSGLHVVVDGGNGAGGFYAQLLERLGAHIAGSQFLTPDGYFPNHSPNPEDGEAMASLSEAVRKAGADLGVLFDADCDRAALVDGAGRAIHRNRLIALTAELLLSEHPGATIVTDSVVSAGLEPYIQRHGGHLHRFKRGYRNVIDEAIRLNEMGIFCPLAMETSGHAALLENHFLDDGMYLVTRLIIRAGQLQKEGQELCHTLADLAEPKESLEIRIPILAEDYRQKGQDILSLVGGAIGQMPGWQLDSGNREGVRIHVGGENNWFLLRLSVHDPLLVLNAETETMLARDMLSPLHALLKGAGGLSLQGF